jgi:hypothetical protein
MTQRARFEQHVIAHVFRTDHDYLDREPRAGCRPTAGSDDCG